MTCDVRYATFVFIAPFISLITVTAGGGGRQQEAARTSGIGVWGRGGGAESHDKTMLMASPGDRGVPDHESPAMSQANRFAQCAAEMSIHKWRMAVT